MSATDRLTATEMRILLRIVGARPGADSSAIHAFIQSHQWAGTAPDQVEGALARLVSLGLVIQRDAKYFASAELQSAFISDCRNCSDTIEEFDVLRRIIERKLASRG